MADGRGFDMLIAFILLFLLIISIFGFLLEIFFDILRLIPGMILIGCVLAAFYGLYCFFGWIGCIIGLVILILARSRT